MSVSEEESLWLVHDFLVKGLEVHSEIRFFVVTNQVNRPGSGARDESCELGQGLFSRPTETNEQTATSWES